MAKVNKLVSVSICVVSVIAVVVSILFLLASFIAPPIIESYVESHDMELVGRKVSIGDIDLNMFLGKVHIYDAVLYEADDTTDFVSFDELYVDLHLPSLLAKKVMADSIKLTGLNVNILQKGVDYNFTDMVDFFFADTTNVDTVPSEWKIVLDNILIDRSNIHYEDLLVGSEFNLRDLSLAIPTINLSNIESDMGLHFDFARGGTLDTRIMLDMDRKLYTLWLDLSNFKMSGLLPYAKEYIDISDIDGYMTTRLNIVGSIEHVLKVKVGGKAGFKDVALSDINGTRFVTIDTCDVEVGNLVLDKYYVALNSLIVKGMNLDYVQYNDSVSTTDLLFGNNKQNDEEIVENAEEAIESESWILTSKKIRFEDVNINYTDNTILRPFEVKLSSMSLNSTNFDTRRRNSATISGHIQRKGIVMINWDGMLDDSMNHRIYCRISNLGLETFSPYSIQYTSYPFVGGTMSFETNTNIVNGNIKSDNNLLLYHPVAGAKEKGVKAEYDLPLGICLYLLTDMDNKVKFRIPVSGNVNDPKFSYSKVIYRAMFNAMLKVAVSPFTAMAKMFNSSSEELHDMLIDLRQTELTSGQMERLDKIASVLEAKPGLSVTMRQHINYQGAELAWCRYYLKRDYFMAQNGYEPTAQELSKIDVESKSVKMFLWEKVKKIGARYDSDMTNNMRSVYGEQVKRDIIRGVDIRDSLVTDYMHIIGVADSVFHVVRMPVDSLLGSKGTNKYVLTVDGMNEKVAKQADMASMEVNGEHVNQIE